MVGDIHCGVPDRRRAVNVRLRLRGGATWRRTPMTGWDGRRPARFRGSGAARRRGSPGVVEIVVEQIDDVALGLDALGDEIESERRANL